MAGNSRVQQLLEEILDSERTPEDVCQTCPEMLPQVRDRLRLLRAVEAQVDQLFPTPGSSPTPAGLPDAGPPHFPGYEVQEVLGHGGMGVVYKARDRRLNRPVALKMLLAGAYARPEELERFLRGAEAEAALRHANIVQVYDVGNVDGRPYFTMEFVEGGNLAERISGTPLPAVEAAALLATLAGAVQAAHDGGIVHRDLKPANVLLTSNGTPKVTDFGLARRLDDHGGLTQSGATLGTPSYMAPEQAQGHSREIGPASDVYALGAILYELLTGRPPFRGETAAETTRQVLEEEPAPPSRLNANAPRDLETICLKCLHKEPPRRYPSAAALADDLQRFLRGEPITARPLGMLGRSLRWARRRPALVGVLVGSLLLAAGLGGGGLWLFWQRAATLRAVEYDLREVAHLQHSSQWAEASAALERARLLLGERGPADLHRRLDRLDQARRDHDLVARLDAIRVNRATIDEGPGDYARADRNYEAAFREAGLGTVHGDSDHPAAQIKASAVRAALVGALDDWAVCATDEGRRAWLMSVARRADPDAWRDRVRDPRLWEDRSALVELARTAPIEGQPVQLLVALGERLQATGGDATALLTRVQAEYPTDFWANFTLGRVLRKKEPDMAMGFFRAALAIRPTSIVVSSQIADVLIAEGRVEEAVEQYRRAIRIAPGPARAHIDAGRALRARGRLDLAIDLYEQALRIDPKDAWAHYNLGTAFLAKRSMDEAIDHFQQAAQLDAAWDRDAPLHASLGSALEATDRRDEAVEHLQRALKIDPRNAQAQNGLRSLLMRQGRGEDVRAAWQQTLEANPPEHDAWFGYAELCMFLGHEDEYRRARQALLDRFGASTDSLVAERTGKACLLLPASEDELRRVSELIENAVNGGRLRRDWDYPYILFARGLAEYRQGRLESAIATLRGDASRVMGPAPQLIIAMAQHSAGKTEEARRTFAAAVLDYDWTAARADSRDPWICHVLRREAEAMVVPNLHDLLAGKAPPRDNEERLAMLGVSQFQELYGTVARLYAAVFAADPGLAAARRPESRHRAATFAALAGSGRSAEASVLSDEERTQWREQAREWLRAELVAWAQELDRDPAAERVLVQQTLTKWRANPDLSGLRDSDALDRMSPTEREECRTLWRDIDALLRRAQALE